MSGLYRCSGGTREIVIPEIEIANIDDGLWEERPDEQIYLYKHHHKGSGKYYFPRGCKQILISELKFVSKYFGHYTSKNDTVFIRINGVSHDNTENTLYEKIYSIDDLWPIPEPITNISINTHGFIDVYLSLEFAFTHNSSSAEGTPDHHVKFRLSDVIVTV